MMNKATGKAEADYMELQSEQDVKQGKQIKLFDPVHPCIYKYIDNYDAFRGFDSEVQSVASNN